MPLYGSAGAANLLGIKADAAAAYYFNLAQQQPLSAAVAAVAARAAEVEPGAGGLAAKARSELLEWLKRYDVVSRVVGGGGSQPCNYMIVRGSKACTRHAVC